MEGMSPFGMLPIVLLDWQCKQYPLPLDSGCGINLVLMVISLAICGIYYAFWIYILPHFGRYRIRQELLVLDGETAKTHRLVKVPLGELEVWDAEHDVLGQKLASSQASGNVSQSGEHGEKDEKNYA